MRIQAYDVHLKGKNGHLHFQVLLPKDAAETDPLECAVKYLQLIEESGELKDDTIQKLGHDQGANGDQEKQIKDVGYAIYKVHPT